MESAAQQVEIYIYRDGQYLGPFSDRELRRHWANGLVHGTDYVWYEGMADWITLRDYFGVPAALTSAAIRSGEVDLSFVRARLAEMAPPEAQAEEPVFEYGVHPAMRAGTVIFVTWTLWGVAFLVALLLHQRQEAVLLAVLAAVVGGVWQVMRFRNLGSGMFLLSCLVVPLGVWWLALTFLPRSTAEETRIPGIEKSASEPPVAGR